MGIPLEHLPERVRAIARTAQEASGYPKVGNGVAGPARGAYPGGGLPGASGAKRSKYGAIKTQVDGITFDSKRETDVVADRRAENPLHSVQREDLRRIITKGLSKNERLILILYYYEEMTMKEIGATLDLSESRVSQMHSAILDRLRATLDGRKDDLSAPD